MSDEQEKIFDVKYSAPKLRTLSPVDLSKTVKATLFKISIITGWNIPEQQEVRNILYDQMEKKLMEDHADLNTDEIEFAFRAYGTTVKEWGKNINLTLLDEILIPYKSKRLQLSQIEERKTKQPAQISQAEPIVDEAELLENVKTVFLKTKIVGLIPVKVYETLEQQGEINLTIDEKNAIRSRVIARLNQEAIEGGENEVRALKMMNKRDYEIRVRNECKKQAAANYFIKQQEIDNF